MMTIERFYNELITEIRSQQITEEEGGSQEQVFTQYVLDLLADAGETENARVCFDLKESKDGKTLHKLNGYALSENYETLDLFVSVFKGTDNQFTLTKQEAETSCNQIARFFRNAVYKDYVNELEEASEVFDLAHTLAETKEVKEFLTRVNVFVLTNGNFKSKIPEKKEISGYPLYYRVIDLEYLHNISDNSRIPIEINFAENGGVLPCVVAPSENDDYQSYLAIVPSIVLANIYEQFGARLLEQNVRSFLQFTGKINKGIRKTIKEEPHMFLAFNNGIAATAEELKFDDLPDNKGKAITWAKDFQIVNGGQTTASLYHTWKKDKADISDIWVQIKLSVVKQKENFNNIVNRIAEYANTQNKVSTSDLSSNKPFHIEMEKLSRTIWASPVEGQSTQTRWFYERARGSYRNARLKEGTTKAKKKAFDLRNPRKQMITKELTAKYVNAFCELYHGKKLVIGPHIVVRGSQKNYAAFLNYNMPEKPDNIYFEDVVAKAIIFKTAEKVYGVKPNSIGDMRYLTVPYTIAYIGHQLDWKLDFYKIWKEQKLTDEFQKILYDLLVFVENYIRESAPGSLYSEWTKKAECWNGLKQQKCEIDLSGIKSYYNPENTKRKTISEEEIDKQQIQLDYELIKSISPKTWKNIEKWGRETGQLGSYSRDIAFNMISKIKNNSLISDVQRKKAIEIIDKIIKNAPDLLYSEEEPENETASQENNTEITMDLIEKMVKWDKKNKRLKPHHFKYMFNVLNGKTPFDERAKRYAKNNLKHVEKFGFRFNKR